MANPATHAAYKTLLDGLIEQGSLPASQIPDRLMAEVERLVENGVLGWKRSGSGRRLDVLQAEALTRLRTNTFPGDADLTTTPRAKAIADSRNSKRAPGVEGEPVLLRALSGDSMIQNGTAINICALTRETGVCAVLLKPNDTWQYAGRLLTVENLECFLEAERLGVAFDACIYTAGRMSGAFLAWVASLVTSGAHVVHCGDYDPTGLDEFERLHTATSGEAQLHCPPDLRERFLRYSRSSLLEGHSSTVLQRLRASELPAIKDVIDLIHECNAGLEQEALLIDLPDHEA